MSRQPHPFFRQLERGQGFVEYGLMIFLIAVVAIPIVVVLANPSDFREGAIYQQIYVPILCAVQGRDPETCDAIYEATRNNDNGTGRLGGYGYPTATGAKELGESGGEDDDVALNVALKIEDDAGSAVGAQVPPGTYTFIAEVVGAPNDVTFSFFEGSDTTPFTGSSALPGDPDNTDVQQFTFDLEVTTQQTYRVVAQATRTSDTTSASGETTFEVNESANPDDASNLFPAGFQLWNTDEDRLAGSLTEGSSFDPGNYTIVALTTGGTPVEVDMSLSGGLTNTATLTEVPFSLYGYDAGDYTGAIFGEGSYTVTVTDLRDASGDSAPTENMAANATVNFTINPEPDPIAINSFEWVTASDDTVQGTLTEGGTIIVSDAVNFRAITNGGPVDSVVINLNGPSSNPSVTDNGEPYTIFAASAVDSYDGRALSPGDYTITATPFREDGGTGGIGTPLTVNFTIEATGPTVERVRLMDASNNNEIVTLTDGLVLPDTTNIAFEVLANGDTDSVRIEISGDNGYNNAQNENALPFSSFGDSSGNFTGQDLNPGRYTIRVYPWSQDNRTGTEGPTYTASFTVSEAVCPAYTVQRISAGCTSISSERVTINLEVRAACGPGTQVAVGFPLGSDIQMTQAGLAEDGPTELDETYRYQITLDSDDGYNINTMTQICQAGQSLELQAIFPDNNVDTYEFGNNFTTFEQKGN